MFACAGVCVCEGEGVEIWRAEGSIKDDFTAVVTYEQSCQDKLKPIR